MKKFAEKPERGADPGRRAPQTLPLRSELNDEELMARLATGEVDVLAELYIRHEQMVRRAVRRSAPEISDANVEDLTQDVFLVLYRKANSYDSKNKLRSYLYGIAVKCTQSWRRNLWRRRQLLSQADAAELPVGRPSDPPPDTSAELRQVVAQALSRLSKEQRHILLLHAVDGFSGEEIAAALGLNHQTVRTRLHRARQTLLSNVNRETWMQVLSDGAPS